MAHSTASNRHHRSRTEGSDVTYTQGTTRGERRKTAAAANATREPTAAAEWVGVNDLVPWTGNPRRIDDASVQRVVRSIERFGFGAPIVARRENAEVIAGHTRRLAVLSLLSRDAGFTVQGAPGPGLVPVRWLDVSAADAHVLALADNRLTEKTAWDEDVLRETLGAWDEIDREDAGWTSEEFETILAGSPTFEPTSIDDQGRLDQLAPVKCPKCGHEFQR